MPSQPSAQSLTSEQAPSRQRDPAQLLVFLGAGWPGMVSRQNGLSIDRLANELEGRGFVVHRIQSVAEAQRCLREKPIGAAIVDLDFTGGSLFRVYESLQSAEPPVPALLLGSPTFQGQTLQPKALGRYDEYVRVDETCTLEYLVLHLKGLLLRVYPMWKEAAFKEPEKDSDDFGGAPMGQLVCVFSAKGGSGKTTIAANLAVGLAQLRNRRVVLIDGDLYFGDIDIMLSAQGGPKSPRRSLVDVAKILNLPDGDWGHAPSNALSSVDAHLLDQVLHTHPSGVRILPAPPRPEAAERVPQALIRRVINVCRHMSEYTIIDMPSAYSEFEIEVMDTATRIIVVLKPEMSSLRNTTLFLEYAETFGWKDRLVLVLNRADSGKFTKISREDVESHLGTSTVPIISSGSIPQAVSEGYVVVTRFPGSKVAQGFEKVMELVDGDPKSADKPKRSLLGLFGRKQAAAGSSS